MSMQLFAFVFLDLFDNYAPVNTESVTASFRTESFWNLTIFLAYLLFIKYLRKTFFIKECFLVLRKLTIRENKNHQR